MKYAIIPPIVINGVKEFDLKIEELMNRPEPESYFRKVPKSINELKEFISLAWILHWQLIYKDRGGNINTEITIAY